MLYQLTIIVYRKNYNTLSGPKSENNHFYEMQLSKSIIPINNQ